MSNLEKEKILLLGASGMVGSAIKKNFLDRNLFFYSPSRKEVDLLKIDQLMSYLDKRGITMIINAAAKVGGIYANISQPIDFYYENSVMQDNIIYAMIKHKIKKIVFLSSACVYPEHVTVIPEMEDVDLSYERLHKTNLGYALAKANHVDTLKMVYEKYDLHFICLFICNLFGVNDNFNDQSSHFIPSVMKQLHEAKKNNKKEIEFALSKNISREFMFNYDFAVNLVDLLDHFYFKNDFMNFGSGEEYNLYDLLLKIKEVVGFNGDIKIKTPKIIGNHRRLMSSKKLKEKVKEIKLTDVMTSLKLMYDHYLEKYEK